MAAEVSRKGSRLRLAAWLLFDFADTAFVVVVVTFVWGLYFKRVVVAGPAGDLLWGLSGALSTLLVIFAAPLLGAAADEAGLKARFLTLFSLLSIAASACLALIGPGMVVAGMALFVAANSTFQVGNVFYHAFLPELAPTTKLSRISGYGWALGYVGAIVAVLAVSPLLAGGLTPANLPLLRLAFPLQAALFLLFALPAFIVLPRGEPGHPLGRAFLRAGLSRLGATWRGVRELSQLTRYLVAYVLYNDGLNTVLYFSIIYAADTLGLTMRQLVPLYIMVQTAGIVGALLFGRLGDRLGIKPTLLATLVLWLAVLVAAWMAESQVFFTAVAVSAGLLIGSTQALSRAMMALLTPPGRSAEFFSFYGVSGRVSAAAGPLLFGLVSYLCGSQRPAILSVAAFFLAGLLLLLRVDVERGIVEKMARSHRR
jgi:UMF1 family MFS transporter